MNRQLRRAQEKAEQKQQQDKQKAKAAKRSKRERLREKRSSPKRSPSAKPEKRRPDFFFRFAGPITLFTTVFIVLQSIAPRPEQTSFGIVVEVAYYFIFGYGLCIWLVKRGRAHAPWLASGVALALAAILQLVTLFMPTLTPNLLVFAVGSGLAVLGALAGEWIAKRML